MESTTFSLFEYATRSMFWTVTIFRLVSLFDKVRYYGTSSEEMGTVDV